MSRIEDKKWGRAGKRKNEEEEAFPIKGKNQFKKSYSKVLLLMKHRVLGKKNFSS